MELSDRQCQPECGGDKRFDHDPMFQPATAITRAFAIHKTAVAAYFAFTDASRRWNITYEKKPCSTVREVFYRSEPISVLAISSGYSSPSDGCGSWSPHDSGIGIALEKRKSGTYTRAARRSRRIHPLRTALPRYEQCAAGDVTKPRNCSLDTELF